MRIPKSRILTINLNIKQLYIISENKIINKIIDQINKIKFVYLIIK
jgi:hypothetical protein